MSAAVVALDGMGGDNAPAAPVAGAIEAAREGIRILLVGDEPALAGELARQGARRRPPASRSCTPRTSSARDEEGARAVRAKPGPSVVAGLPPGRRGPRRRGRLGRQHRRDARRGDPLHAPHPGGHPPGDRGRAARAGRRPVVLLDAGASAEARPEHFPQLALMGRLFARDVLGIAEPRVGLLSIGEEEGKGSEAVLAAHALLRDTPGFVGNVEGRDIPRGASTSSSPTASPATSS